MDKRVFITFLGLIFLIGAVLGIRMMLSEDCESPEISVDPLSPVVGQSVLLKSNYPGENLKWDFGDGKSSSGNVSEHKYSSSGTYSVKAIVGDNCSSTKEIIIRGVLMTEIVIPKLNIPAVIYAGVAVTLFDETKNANSWKWNIEKGDSSDKRQFNTTFKNTGNYKLKVSVRGEYLTGDTTLLVRVVRKPEISETRPEPKSKPEPKPANPVVSSIDLIEFSEQFMTNANNLSDNKDQASDKFGSLVNKNCCGNVSVILVKNNLIDPKELGMGELKRKMINGELRITNVEPTFGRENCISKVKLTVMKIE